MDWLEDDPCEQEVMHRVNQNEREAISKQEWNMGYLAGTEWAESNWKQTTDPLAYSQGVALGIESAADRQAKFRLVGLLNVALLTCPEPEAIRALLAKIDSRDANVSDLEKEALQFL